MKAATKGLVSLGAMLLVSAAASPGSAAVAQASGGCPVNPFYSVTATSVRIPFSRVPTFRNGPGGHVAATRGYSGTSSFQVTAGAESEVGAVLAKAKVSISASLTKSNTTSTTITYSHHIPKGKFGNLRYVSYGKKVVWKKQIFNSSCKIITLSKGVINFPTSTEGWYYWTTNQ